MSHYRLIKNQALFKNLRITILIRCQRKSSSKNILSGIGDDDYEDDGDDDDDSNNEEDKQDLRACWLQDGWRDV